MTSLRLVIPPDIPADYGSVGASFPEDPYSNVGNVGATDAPAPRMPQLAPATAWKRPRVAATPRKLNSAAPRSSASAWLVSLSLAANVILLAFKLFIVFRSKSLVVVASAVDSVLDLIAQLIILAALSAAGEADVEAWPLGRSRLEPVGIIVVASLMGFASLQIVSESLITLYDGLEDPAKAKAPFMDWVAVSCLGLVIVTKFVLYVLCRGSASSSVQALAEDHLNDVLSNVIVLAAAWSSHLFHGVWFLDPVGAIGISLFIMMRWIGVGKEQAAMLVGRAAHPGFLERVADIAVQHDPRMQVDWVRAFHFGKRFIIEIEAVMDRYTTLMVAHDVSLSLQKKIEMLSEVERAHVHVDYEFRDENEHKVISPEDEENF